MQTTNLGTSTIGVGREWWSCNHRYLV